MILIMLILQNLKDVLIDLLTKTRPEYVANIVNKFYGIIVKSIENENKVLKQEMIELGKMCQKHH